MNFKENLTSCTISETFAKIGLSGGTMHPIRKMALIGIPEGASPDLTAAVRFMRPNRELQKSGSRKNTGGSPPGIKPFREETEHRGRQEPLPLDVRWAAEQRNGKLVCGHCGYVCDRDKFRLTSRACVYTCPLCYEPNYVLGVTFVKPRLAREFHTQTQCGHCGDFHNTELYQLFGLCDIVFCPGCKLPGFILPFR